MKVYAVIGVSYDYYRFEDFLGVAKSIEDAKEKFCTYEEREIAYYASSDGCDECDKYDNEERCHYWICECEL